MALAVVAAVAAATAAGAGVCYWIPKPLIWLGERLFPVIFRFKTRTQEIALTIDDVPRNTKELLEILNCYSVRVTLFVISEQVLQEHIPLLVQAVKTGHVLGNHGHTDRAHARLSCAELAHELDSCDRLINSIYEQAGVKRVCKLYRPGCGLFSPSMLKQVSQAGYTLVLGSVYPHDPAVRLSSVNAAFICCKLEPGDIVIVHDRPWTVPLLRTLLPRIQTAGYKFVTLDTAAINR